MLNEYIYLFMSLHRKWDINIFCFCKIPSAGEDADCHDDTSYLQHPFIIKSLHFSWRGEDPQKGWSGSSKQWGSLSVMRSSDSWPTVCHRKYLKTSLIKFRFVWAFSALWALEWVMIKWYAIIEKILKTKKWVRP